MRVRNLLNKKTDNTIIIFLRGTIASFVSFGLDFAVMVVLTELLNVHYLLSSALGFIFGTTLNYFISIKWVFPHRRVKARHLEYGAFIIIGIIGLGLNALFLFLLTDYIHIHYTVSRMIAGTSIFFLNFLFRKFLLFR